MFIVFLTFRGPLLLCLLYLQYMTENLFFFIDSLSLQFCLILLLILTTLVGVTVSRNHLETRVVATLILWVISTSIDIYRGSGLDKKCALYQTNSGMWTTTVCYPAIRGVKDIIVERYFQQEGWQSGYVSKIGSQAELHMFF